MASHSSTPIFATVYDSLPAQRERLSLEKNRYPKLTTAERRLLTSFFEEAWVNVDCSFLLWEQYAASISQDILNTAWMLTTILERLLSKFRWSQQPALNQWTAKILGQQQPNTEQARPASDAHYQQFMFNPKTYSDQECMRLRAICIQEWG